MNIALIGSGGREDALCRKLKDSKKSIKFFVYLAMQEQLK